MGRGNASRYGHTPDLGGAHQGETLRGCDLAEMQPCSCHFGKRNIAGHRQGLSLRRSRSEAQAGGHFTGGGNGIADQPAILGMGDNHHAQHRRIAQ